MIDAVEKAMRNMPSAKGKDAGVACIVGFISEVSGLRSTSGISPICSCRWPFP